MAHLVFVVPQHDPERGWRYWYLAGDPPYLTSANSLDRWPHAEAVEARCSLWPHEAPDPACKCGVYAARRLEDLEAYGFPALSYLVIGEVLLWGRIVEAGSRYRAQFARPARLWIVSETVPEDDDPGSAGDRLMDLYGVPTGLRPGGDALASVYRLGDHPNS